MSSFFFLIKLPEKKNKNAKYVVLGKKSKNDK
jgi:hypothetical protein